jgi:hypothetical protein
MFGIFDAFPDELAGKHTLWPGSGADGELPSFLLSRL